MNHVCKKINRLSARGFTLVELLVVISIIALLMSILVPSLGKAKSAALRVKCAHNLTQVNLALNFYMDRNDDTYPCAEDPIDPNKNIWLWMGRGWRPIVEPYIGTGTVRSIESILFCPQDLAAKKSNVTTGTFDYTSYAYSMCFYHSPEQVNRIKSVPTQYTPASVQPSLRQRRFNVARPAEKIVIGEWDSNHLLLSGNDPGWWGCQGSRNFLFADGRVAYLKAGEIRKANDGNANPNVTVDGIRGVDWPP